MASPVAEKAGEGFAGQVVLITGAAGGIGAALVQAFADRGAIVAAADRSWPAQSSPGSIARMHLDVADAALVTQVVESAAAARGRLDVLVNVAGVVSHGSAMDLPAAEWDRVMNINLRGSFLCCQAALRRMKPRGYGRIVNLGSVVGKNAGNARPWIAPEEQKVAGNVAYGVSKAGVHAMTGFLAKEAASAGITVNAVAPGPIATAMTSNFPAQLRANIPVGRMGSLDDVVNAILFLASPASGFITGEVLDVNGGMWCD
jgi:3-oxoacyl-[acyl-carrier protein] reductase